MKLYDVIYADPAWRYDFAETDNRKIENHYPTMSIEEICALQVPSKPYAVRTKIKEWFPNADRLEMFARKPNELFVEEDFEGWDLWGNESENLLKI